MLLLAAFLFPAACFAQTKISKSDSLLYILSNARDTTRVNVLNQLSSSYWYSDPLKTFEYARQAMELAGKLGFQKGLVTAYNNTGVGYYQQNKYDEALSWYNKAVEEHRKMGNYRGEANVLTNIGLIYWKKGEYPEAVKYNMQALKIWEEHQDESGICGIYDNLGNVYSDQEQYDQALTYYNRSLAIQKKNNKSAHEQSMTLSNIGTAYLGKNDLPKALTYFQESLQLLEEDEKESRAVSLSNIGLTYLEMRSYEKAQSYLDDALRVQQEIADNDGMIHTLMGLSQTFQHTGKLRESVVHAQKALTLAQEIDDRSAQAEASLILSDIKARMGDHQQAYRYYRDHVNIRDSISNKENIFKIAHLQAGLETEKKQAELELLKKETEQQAFRRNALLAGLIALLIIAGLIVSRQRLKLKQNNQLLEINARLTQQSQTLADQAEKLRNLDKVKSTFFANISHEFRTPLTLILNGLSDKINSAEPADQPAFEMMQRNAKRLLNLINQLLDLSRLDAQEMKMARENCDLIQLLQVTHASFSSLAHSRQVAFNLSLPEDPLISRVDIDKIEKILYNLLSNAFKFTPVNGTIHLKAEIKHSGPNKCLQVTVQNTGHGIPADQLPHVFNRFYQGKQYYSDEQGTGIGLALTKELVELHDGKVWAESEEGQGACFIVQLPLSDADGEAVFSEGKLVENEFTFDQTHNAPTEREKDLPTILVVEDNQDLRNYIRGSLGHKYQIVEAENGLIGLEKAFALIPDLIISDWMMPGMDGITICSRLKTDERTSHIPIIMLTALATGEARLQGLETGADEYLTKPFDNRELQVRINNLIESRRQLRERFSRELHLGPRKIPVTSMDEKFLERVMEAVETHLGDPDFSMEKFGQQVSLSRMQLHRKLKALTGESPGDFLRSMRLKRAKSLLEAQSGNVSEVAYSVGFNNLSYFSRCYKETFGVSPSMLQ
jgi:signal transduction histidine kinase/DNA-binding response OmpR family regulator/Tfp pilus assembly protein PilF